MLPRTSHGCFPFQHTCSLVHKKFPCSSYSNSLDLTCLWWDLDVSLAVTLLQVREGSSSACTSELPLPHPTPVKGYSHHCMVIVAVAPGLFAPTFLLRLTTHDKPNRTKPNPDFSQEFCLKTDSLWLYYSWLVCPCSLQLFIYYL